MLYPIPCPKGKYIFHRADQLATCNCKFPTKKCKKLKRKVNDLLDHFVGGAHDRFRATKQNKTSGNEVVRVFDWASSAQDTE